MTQKEPMNLQINRQREKKGATSYPTARGGVTSNPRRIIDVSASGSYKPITFRMSEELAHRLKLATAVTNVTQVEFIISVLEPAIDEALRETGL